MKRGRRAGERRAQRQRAELDTSVAAELAALPQRSNVVLDEEFQVSLEAAIANYERQLKKQTATARERLREGRIVMNRFFEIAEHDADREVADAETAMQHVLARLRSGELSRNQLAVLARVISGQLASADLAIAQATAAVESAAHEVESWIHRVSVAVEHEHDDLAGAARARVEEWRSTASETEATLREYIELRDRLHDLGRVVLELADRQDHGRAPR